MNRIRVFLRAPLFAPRIEPHVPAGAMVLDGVLVPSDDDGPSGGMLVRVDGWRSDSGAPLEGATTTLFLPIAKVDHILAIEEG